MSALVIGKFYSSADLGLYSRGQKISELPSQYLSGIVQKVSYPVMSRLQDDNERLLQVYRKYLGMSSMVIFFLMVLLTAVAESLVRIMLTEKWMGAVPYLRIFCLALMFDHICSFNNNMMYVKGRSDLFFWLEIIKKVIVVPLLVLAIPCGVMAICFVPVVHEMVDLFLGTYCVRHILGFRKASPLQDYGIYLLLALLACVPAFLLCQAGLSDWLALFLGGGSAFVLYIVLLWKDENMREVVRTVRTEFARQNNHG